MKIYEKEAYGLAKGKETTVRRAVEGSVVSYGDEGALETAKSEIDNLSRIVGILAEAVCRADLIRAHEMNEILSWRFLAESEE